MAGNSRDKQDQIVANARRQQDDRAKGYRERALKLYPWICGRCQREFTHKNLSELTVHHRDHNHDNNPNDGTNWELLCVYCHDNEHSRYEDEIAAASAGAKMGKEEQEVAMHNPFAGLKDMLKKD